MKIPRPRDGWRSFAGEVGVIVLGVLIALGAQQAVESWQVRKDVTTFREAMSAEIGATLYTYHYRRKQTVCLSRQLNEADQWLAAARDGSLAPAIYFRGVRGLSVYRSAWDSRDPKVVAALPAQLRQQYAEFYDSLANNKEVGDAEAESFVGFIEFSEPGPLSLAERRKIASSIMITRVLSGINDDNLRRTFERAKELNIVPTRPKVGDSEGNIPSCKSIRVPYA